MNIRQGDIHEMHSLIQTDGKHGLFTVHQSVEKLNDQNRVDSDEHDCFRMNEDNPDDY